MIYRSFTVPMLCYLTQQYEDHSSHDVTQHTAMIGDDMVIHTLGHCTPHVTRWPNNMAVGCFSWELFDRFSNEVTIRIFKKKQTNVLSGLLFIYLYENPNFIPEIDRGEPFIWIIHHQWAVLFPFSTYCYDLTDTCMNCVYTLAYKGRESNILESNISREVISLNSLFILAPCYWNTKLSQLSAVC